MDMQRKLETFFYRRTRREENRKRADALQYAYLVFLLCFVLGILGANMLPWGIGSGVGGWNSYWMENLRHQEITGMGLFSFIFSQRMPILVLFLALAFTNLALMFGIAYIGWQGFCVGTLMSSAVIAYGVKGIFLILVGMLPHYILYFILYFSYVWMMQERKCGQRIPQVGNRRKMVFGLYGILFFFIFVTGIFLESYINPYFVKNFLKFI